MKSNLFGTRINSLVFPCNSCHFYLFKKIKFNFKNHHLAYATSNIELTLRLFAMRTQCKYNFNFKKMAKYIYFSQ